MTEVFGPLGRREAEAFNMPDLRTVVVPHPLATRPDTELRRIAAGLKAAVIEALLASGRGR